MKLKIEMNIFLAAAACLVLTGCGTTGGPLEKKHVPPPVVKTDDQQEHVETDAGDLQVSPSVVDLSQSVVDADFIRQRYQSYEEKLEQWRNLSGRFGTDRKNHRPEGWNECYMTLVRIHDDYGTLQEKGGFESRGGASSDLSGIVSLLQEDISFTDSFCEKLLLTSSAGNRFQPIALIAVREMEKKVRISAEQEEYDQVIVSYEDLLEAGQSPSPDIMEIYGTALQKTGRIEDAAVVLQEVIDGRGEVSSWQLRQRIAVLLLASGQAEAATDQYSSLADDDASQRSDAFFVSEQLALLENANQHKEELALYCRVLKGSLIFDGRHLPREMAGAMERLELLFGDSRFTIQAKRIYTGIDLQAGNWATYQLADLTSLIEKKQFDRAHVVLADLQEAKLPENIELRVIQLAEKMQQAEDEDKETRHLLLGHAQTVQWQEGLDLMDQRQYDEAILVFTALLESEYEREAMDKIREAQKMAAIGLRKMAAALFVKSRKVNDIEKKGDLLLESRHLLLEILEKYPEVEIIDKVKQNLQVIEEQIYQLDPGLLEQRSEFGYR
ncbi:MAG: hypothetical protein U9R66_00570 [Thermodesulfobacteriota bacterium]|nr:hypothetical protein [Thermodesulfobacteriota bacterium]